MEFNLDNIKKGDVYKNYEHLCTALEASIKSSGKGKVYQLKRIAYYIHFEKDGHKFKILEVYKDKTPLDEIKNSRNGKRTLREYESFIKENSVNWIGQFDLDYTYFFGEQEPLEWKCYKCGAIFEKTVNAVLYPKENLRCELCNMSKGARTVGKILNELKLNTVLEYTFDNLYGEHRKLKFDFAVVINSKLVCLIEYDGGHHDYHEVIIKYDKLKNEYCEKNNIPLLRIHHTEKNIGKVLFEFLSQYVKSKEIQQYFIKKIKKEEEKLILLEKEKELIKNKIEELKKYMY